MKILAAHPLAPTPNPPDPLNENVAQNPLFVAS